MWFFISGTRSYLCTRCTEMYKYIVSIYSSWVVQYGSDVRLCLETRFIFISCCTQCSAWNFWDYISNKQVCVKEWWIQFISSGIMSLLIYKILIIGILHNSCKDFFLKSWKLNPNQFILKVFEVIHPFTECFGFNEGQWQPVHVTVFPFQ